MLSAKRLMLAFAAFERALIREPLRKGNRPATAACGAYHARKRTVLNGLPSRYGDLRSVRGPVRRATGLRTYDAELDLLGITINCPWRTQVWRSSASLHASALAATGKQA